MNGLSSIAFAQGIADSAKASTLASPPTMLGTISAHIEKNAHAVRDAAERIENLADRLFGATPTPPSPGTATNQSAGQVGLAHEVLDYASLQVARLHAAIDRLGCL